MEEIKHHILQKQKGKIAESLDLIKVRVYLISRS
jgi:hypothetical protein